MLCMLCVLVAPKAMACASDADCAPGLTCNLSGGPGTGTCEPSNNPGCTANFPSPEMPGGEGGIFSSIVGQVTAVLNNLSALMFTGITANGDFQTIITLLLTIYVAVYGILFTFGMVQITMVDFAVRCVKIAIVGMLLDTPVAWGWFSGTVIPFFQGSMNTIINWVTAIAVGPGGVCSSLGILDPMCAAPFGVLDAAIASATSANMVVLLFTTFTTGPYGPLIGVLLLMATGSFLKMMITSLWVYTMALIMQALLFGLAPIFLAFLLFSRTRHLFDGWLNQLVNSVLQPVLLFTFLAFFVILIGQCLGTLLLYNICWTKLPAVFAGTPLGTEFWRFNLFAGGFQMPAPAGLATGVEWTFSGPQVPIGTPPQPIFPVPILLPLVYWVLVDLCSRFIDVCVDIAKNLAGASTDLRMGMESMGSWFSKVAAGGSPLGGGGGSGSNPLGKLAEMFGGGAKKAAGAAGAAAGIRPGGGVGSLASGFKGVGAPPAGKGAVAGIKDQAGSGMITPR